MEENNGIYEESFKLSNTILLVMYYYRGIAEGRDQIRDL